VLCCSPAWTPRLDGLQRAFLSDYAGNSGGELSEADSLPHLCSTLGTAGKEAAGRLDQQGEEGANLSLCSTAVGARYDCLATTLEMVFRDVQREGAEEEEEQHTEVAGEGEGEQAGDVGPGEGGATPPPFSGSSRGFSSGFDAPPVPPAPTPRGFSAGRAAALGAAAVGPLLRILPALRGGGGDGRGKGGSESERPGPEGAPAAGDA